MKTKTTFDVNSENISNGFQKLVDWVQQSKVSVSSKDGKEYIKLPLLIAIIISCIVPFAVVAGVVIALACGINISFQQEMKDEKSNNGTKVIEIK